MKSRTRKLAVCALLLALGLGALAVLRPRTYPVAKAKKRTGIQYWQLPTGSRIAFVRVAAKTRKAAFPLVYVHGGPGGHCRESLINSLAPLAGEGYDCYFYDQIGSGASDRLADITEYTVDRHIRDLDAITRKLGGRVILIGQSWGAILATLFTARYPERTERLVLTSPGPIFPINRLRAALPAPDSVHLQAPLFSNAQGNQKITNLRFRAMAFLADSFGWKLASDDEADAFTTYRGYEVDKSTVCDTAKIPAMEAGGGFYAGVRTLSNLLDQPDPRPALRNLKTPVLVLKGECDNQPWGYTSEYLEVFRNHRMSFIPGAGHFLWVEQPALCLRAIRQFLREPAPGQGLP